MATIKQVRQRVQNLNAGAVAEKSLAATAEQLANLNAEQMHQGLNQEGQPIGKYRNNYYAAFKNRMNPLPGFGNPDLRLTGSFYQGIKVEVAGEKITIDSTDEKSAALQKKYGQVIFGLSDNYKSEYLREFFGPTFRGNMKSELKL